MNKDQFAGNWKQLRGQIKAKWGQLTDNELDQIAGDYEMLLGKIQEKYGTSRAQVERELDALVREPARVGSETAPRTGASGTEHRPGFTGTEYRSGSMGTERRSGSMEKEETHHKSGHGGTEKPSHKAR